MSATISAVLTGTAGLTKADAGTLILTGTNTYGGGTTIAGGTLQIGNGGATGSVTGDIANSGRLSIDRTGTLALAGIHYFEGIVWLVAVALIVDQSRRLFLNPLMRRWLDGLCGALFIGFGVRLALARE